MKDTTDNGRTAALFPEHDAGAKDRAAETFRRLVRRYGLQWHADVPREAWDQLAACNALLDERDRRTALGLL